MELRNSLTADKSPFQEDVELIRMKHFNNITMAILVRFTKEKLTILGDEKGNPNVKLI